MPGIDEARSFLIEWNNTFPLDRNYRVKYNIAFNSPEHKNVNQIDVYLEWLEEQLFDEHTKLFEEKKKKEKLFNKGEWLSETEIPEDVADDWFDKIDLSKVNNG